MRELLNRDLAISSRTGRKLAQLEELMREST